MPGLNGYPQIRSLAAQPGLALKEVEADDEVVYGLFNGTDRQVKDGGGRLVGLG